MNPKAVPTLASLRRRASRRPSAQVQPDLFSTLFEDSLAEAAALAPPPAIFLPLSAEPSQTLAPPQEISANPAVHAGMTRAEITESVVSSFVPAVADPEETAEPESSSRTWSVSSLVRHVRGLVERGYGQVTVEGEISNWRPAGSGHCYFTVKDAGAQLSAVLFRRQATLLRFRPSDGDAVRLHGQLSVYESRGQMQLIVEWMEQVGLGALLAEVQRLKERLRREGLFDRKRPLPPFPRCIGVITSLQGAALRDIVKVCRRRHAAVQLLIYPAAVQGPNCPAEIAAGLRWFNAHPDRAEVLLVARGGGSWEDLHGFDSEAIARAIAASILPVITGIGHAPDTTIADAAADVCAPTPSAGAELLTAAQYKVEEHVTRLHGRLLRAGSYELLRAQGRFARLSAAGVLRRVQDTLNRRAQRLDELAFRAEAAQRNRLGRQAARLAAIGTRLHRQSPAARLHTAAARLHALESRLQAAAERTLQQRNRRLGFAAARLDALSPLRVLERGYALVYGPDGALLRDARAVDEGQEIRARLADGELRALTLAPASAK